MRLTVQRDAGDGPALLGSCLVDGHFLAFSLENRALSIPAGSYNVVLYYSLKNKMIVPLLEEVPGRRYIEIHPANFYRELEGCLALGLTRAGEAVEHSRVAVEALCKLLRPALRMGTVEIDVKDPV